jgi:hypothetical protein
MLGDMAVSVATLSLFRVQFVPRSVLAQVSMHRLDEFDEVEVRLDAPTQQSQQQHPQQESGTPEAHVLMGEFPFVPEILPPVEAAFLSTEPGTHTVTSASFPRYHTLIRCPMDDELFAQLPPEYADQMFSVYPLLFTQGINEQQSIAIRVGECVRWRKREERECV